MRIAFQGGATKNVVGVKAEVDNTYTANQLAKIERWTKEAKEGNLTAMALLIRLTAAKSIKRAADASAPGEPPHTHRGAWFRKALWYSVDRKRNDAVIGFRASVIGEVAAVHEFGETEQVPIHGGPDSPEVTVHFPERPTVVPALEQNINRFADDWRARIGS